MSVKVKQSQSNNVNTKLKNPKKNMVRKNRLIKVLARFNNTRQKGSQTRMLNSLFYRAIPSVSCLNDQLLCTVEKCTFPMFSVNCPAFVKSLMSLKLLSHLLQPSSSCQCEKKRKGRICVRNNVFFFL